MALVQLFHKPLFLSPSFPYSSLATGIVLSIVNLTGYFWLANWVRCSITSVEDFHVKVFLGFKTAVNKTSSLSPFKQIFIQNCRYRFFVFYKPWVLLSISLKAGSNSSDVESGSSSAHDCPSQNILHPAPNLFLSLLSLGTQMMTCDCICHFLNFQHSPLSCVPTLSIMV